MAQPQQTVEDAFLAYRTTRDPAALAAVYDGTSSRLLAVALHLSSAVNLAEDAVQDTFLFALEHPERWDETRPLMPWLLGILANRLRQGAYRARRTPDPERLTMPEAPDPQSELQANEMLSRIEEAITHLPQPYRTVVLLRLRNGLNPADIAVALDRKPSTVRAQLTRGVEMLRKVLPAGIAALLVGSATAARGMNAARDVVLQRATDVHRSLIAQHRMTLLRGWTAGLAGAIVTAAAIWWAASGTEPSVAPFAPPVDEVAMVSVAAAEPLVREEALTLPAERAPADDREQVAGTGTLTVSVSRPDLVLSSARVEIEPLGRPPRALVHETTTARGTWQSIVPIAPNPPGSRRYAVTGDDGVCTFEGVPAGHWVCRSLGIDRVVEVVGDAHAELELTVAAGCRQVRGLVVDGDDRPVVGARIWISREHRWKFATPIASTDAAGRFELAAAPWTTIGASAAGYAPVAVSVAEQDAGPPLEVVLRLAAPAAELRGRVVDEQRRPVADAEVEIGHLLDAGGSSFAETPQVLARPERTRTDADGWFAFDALVAGQTQLAARGAGFGTAAQVVELVAGAELECSLELRRSATIEGCVQDATGAPVAGASVRIGRRDGLDHCATVTDDSGRYRLQGVTPGERLVEVADYRGGFASRLVACAAGEAVEWNPSFGGVGVQILGRVVDADGRPLSHGWVTYTPHTGLHVHQLDADGRFAIPVSERDAAMAAPVLVFDHDPRDQLGRVWGVPRMVVHDLRVGVVETEIRLPAAAERSAWLRGRIVDAAGAPPRSVVVLRTSDGSSAWRLRLDPLAADGSFEVGPLPAETYTIHLPTGQMRTFGPFELQPRQSLDLGVLRLADADLRLPVRIGLVFPVDERSSVPMQIEARDERDRVVLLRHHISGVSRATDPFVMLPLGRHRVTARTETGLVAECEVLVDENGGPPRVPLLAFARR